MDTGIEAPAGQHDGRLDRRQVVPLGGVEDVEGRVVDAPDLGERLLAV